jgi:hypothetical protein
VERSNGQAEQADLCLGRTQNLHCVDVDEIRGRSVEGRFASAAGDVLDGVEFEI